MNCIERLATAALLHDIGKFWQRTGARKPFTADEEQHFNLKYSHALWTSQFIERYVGDSEVASWARMHHEPDSREAAILLVADWLSSSERETGDNDEGIAPSAALLENLLARVSLGEAASQAETWYLPLQAHGDFGDGFFPCRQGAASEQQYAALWDQFIAALEEPASCEFTHGTWLALMQRYTARIPAATPFKRAGYIPDISLFDHSRTVAALAACFEADGMTEETASEIRTALSADRKDLPAVRQPVCRLVCGNVSGIQDFLYSIASANAAKTLKGRSFTLQLVAEAAAAYLCRAAGVPECCVVYNGGGRFYLLLPRNIELGPTALEMTRALTNVFGGNLAVHIGEVALTPLDFASARFSSMWRQASQNADEAKRRRLTDLAEADYDAVFGYIDEGGGRGHCTACGREAAAGILPEDMLCDTCADFEEIGKCLPHAKWLVWTEPDGTERGWNAFFARLGMRATLAENPHDLPGGRITSVVQLNGFDPGALRQTLRPPAGTTLTYRLLACHWKIENPPGGRRPRTFEELAQASTGVKKLGVLRADVDNLGAMFGMGLGDRASLSRVATLSALLKDFFEGYVNHLAASPEYADYIGMLYAGGDDLFAVGAWNRVIDFAIEVRDRFRRFTGQNPACTLSAGVLVVDDHLPVRHFADLAQDAEEKAKGYERDRLHKNAITLFDTAVGFEELSRFQGFQELLMGVMNPATPETSPLPKSFLRRLYEVWEAYLRERNHLKRRHASGQASLEAIQREARWQRWRWLLTYGLRDFARKNAAAAPAIQELQDRLLDDKKPIEDRLGLPLRWTELLLREEKDHA